MVYGVCRTMLRDLHEAEDATQQVFLSAYTAILGGAAVRDSGAWLATVARNECRGRITAGMRRPLPVDDADLDALPATVDETERRAQVEALRAALSSLPDRQRQAAVLRYVYGLRYGEVATALGLSRPATEALLFRARRALHGTLRPVAGTALAVPAAVRDELALALPGFSEGAGSSVVAAGAAGGLLAKLTAGPAGAKVAAAVAAASTVGVVGTVESDRSSPEPSRPAIVAAERGGVDRAVERLSGAPARQGAGPALSADGARGGVEVSDDLSGPGGAPDGSHSGSKGRQHSSTREREHDRSSGAPGGDDASEGRDPGSANGPASDERDDGGVATRKRGSSDGGESSSSAASELSDSPDSSGSSGPSDSSGSSGSGSSGSSGPSDSSGSSGSGSSGPSGGSDAGSGHGSDGHDAEDESA